MPAQIADDACTSISVCHRDQRQETMSQIIPTPSTGGPKQRRRSIGMGIVMCVAVLLGVFAGGLVIAYPSVDLAVWYALLFGLPLSYVIGKMALSQIYGTPLDRSELQASGIRVWVTMFVLLVVAPAVLVVSIVLTLTVGMWLACWLAMAFFSWYFGSLL